MNQITLKSIGELLEYNFFIPSYQRGYRWTEQQISDLLDDVNEFSPKELIGSNEKTWYCLQPIVVKRKSENQLEVIDGQQRLTTIYMILHYLNQGYVEMRRKKLFGIKYETRELSAAFLNEKLNYNVVDESNIDFFFISKGYKKISEWFKNKGQQFDINYFESKFNTHTKMIWYEIAEHVNPIDVFTRINSGKIPLTNAELIKALFLKSSNFDNTDTEKIQLRQLEIATEWDRMEYALQDDGFWYFINKEENNHATRIEFIFDLMSEHTQATDEYHTFRYFKEKFNDINENAKSWIEIKKIFQYLEEWYHDRELYHKIGYLITTRTNIKTILAKKIEKKKSEFIDWLNLKIKESLSLKAEDLMNIEYGSNSKIREVLLLHIIQTMLNNKKENSHFPFDCYKKEKWDIEHIHAIATNVKVKKEEQGEWLKNNYLESNQDNNENKNNKINDIINGKFIEDNEFSSILEYVLGDEDNNIRNLCLLDRSTNRSYKNDAFVVKRKKIIERELTGTFIPICTRNIFMKYYSKDVGDLKIWNEKDRDSYLNNIQEVINIFLTNQ